jgi:anti-sigma regulatory factor (Ser/Thr protein kinase)/serine/threonine protein phosphatase PrpC
MEASRVARALGWESAEERKITTAVSELVRNILKYAGVGEVLIEEIKDEGRGGVQITARDRGPGIADIDAAMSDHFSSGGTLGLGLPGVKRMMDDFEIESAVGDGTTVVTRKWRATSTPPRAIAGRAPLKKVQAKPAKPAGIITVENSPETPSALQDYAFYGRPFRGERVSGDAALVEKRDNFLFLAIIDGLGHGPAASSVAEKAVTFLRQSWKPDVTATLSGLHQALKGTIGAAAGVCVIDTLSHQLRYGGIGNTVARVFGSRDIRLSSAAGTLGHQIRKPKESALELQDQDVLTLYTDGITERFEISDYTQLRLHKARTIATTLVRRYGKDHDDATCLTLRYSR